jgi:hypothetical protein
LTNFFLYDISRVLVVCGVLGYEQLVDKPIFLSEGLGFIYVCLVSSLFISSGQLGFRKLEGKRNEPEQQPAGRYV